MSKRKKESNPPESLLSWVLLSVAMSVVVVMMYVAYRIGISDRRLILISVIALLAGVLLEGRRLCGKWSKVLWTALGSLLLTLPVLLPGRRERHYDIEDHIQAFPYVFILWFAIIFLAFLGETTIPKLTEGITLLQSIAVVYWVVDYGFVEVDSVILRAVMAIGLLFSLFSAFHAFTYTTLSRTSWLTLSIWSAVIIIILGVDNIYWTHQNDQIENAAGGAHGLYIGLQFFLLGVSSIYIIQNLLMLGGFLPTKKGFFNARYYREAREQKRDLIKRFSNRQVSISHAVFCLFFAGTIFVVNYCYQWVPRNVAVWTVFFAFPFALPAYDFMAQRITYRESR